ncbi:enoyl-CoA hydratase/isomerase family protein [Pseudonocardia eucalypti]|uniref:Enoyl-CoA hydratase/isomerase family protein n=1 Tax=Pseudonocardia eucalypti TaxID=648755 RepID=A0ABP9PPF0_9PSEU|nr:enoyl-CoA hydratase/carnithine racemase [Pseudonocardia eucalypti]
MSGAQRVAVLEVLDEGAVKIVRMSRPQARNAVNTELHTELTEVWGRLAADSATRAVLLCGAGGVFSAGGDAEWLHRVATDQVERARSLDEARRLAGEMLRFPLPVVAAVQGPAVGLGASLASLCDLVIMGESAFFADPHVALGVVAGDGAVATWPFLMSMMRAKEFIYTGARIDAATAVSLGLACRAVPDDQVMAEATALAHRLAELPATALRATKRALNIRLERAAIGVLDYACAAEAETFTLPEIQAKVAAIRARSVG